MPANRETTFPTTLLNITAFFVIKWNLVKLSKHFSFLYKKVCFFGEFPSPVLKEVEVSSHRSVSGGK